MCPVSEKIWRLLEDAPPDPSRNWDWSFTTDKTLSAFEIISKMHDGGDTATGTPGQSANLPPRPAQFKKTLVLDIDETLVQLRWEKLPETRMVATSSLDDSWAYVYFRPYVHEFLAICASMFEVVAFTAGNQEYADQVLDALDPKGNFFSARLYREHCFKYTGDQEPPVLYIKDLRVLGRDLAEVILVDNSLISFAFQTANGLLVRDFDPKKNPDDKELLHILPTLKNLSQVPDVRVLIRKGFNLEEQISSYLQRFQSCQDAQWVSPVSELSAGLPSQAQRQVYANGGVSRCSPNLHLRGVQNCYRNGRLLGAIPSQAHAVR